MWDLVRPPGLLRKKRVLEPSPQLTFTSHGAASGSVMLAMVSPGIEDPKPRISSISCEVTACRSYLVESCADVRSRLQAPVLRVIVPSEAGAVTLKPKA